MWWGAVLHCPANGIACPPFLPLPTHRSPAFLLFLVWCHLNGGVLWELEEWIRNDLCPYRAQSPVKETRLWNEWRGQRNCRGHLVQLPVWFVNPFKKQPQQVLVNPVLCYLPWGGSHCPKMTSADGPSFSKALLYITVSPSLTVCVFPQLALDLPPSPRHSSCWTAYRWYLWSGGHSSLIWDGSAPLASWRVFCSTLAWRVSMQVYLWWESWLKSFLEIDQI